MGKLSRSASGGRHLRWGREVLESLKAHLEINDLLTESQRALLAKEAEVLTALLTKLEAAVTPYREFVDRAHVGIRSRQRVANFLCDEAQRETDGRMRPHRATIDAAVPGGFARLFSHMPLSRVLRVGHERTAKLAIDAASLLRSLPPSVPGTAELAARLERASGTLRGLLDEQERVVEPKRAPLKLAVERAVFELREGLDKMDGRLRSELSPGFIASLYPEVDRRGAAVVDEGDADDDASVGPDDAPGAIG